VLAFTTGPSRCEYLPDREWQLRYEYHPTLDAVAYQARLKEGWRRFGPVMFRPTCAGCRQCLSLRVPTAEFVPNQSQRRAWKRNVDDLAIHVGAPSITTEKEELFERFHRFQHEAKGWPLNPEQNLGVFVANPFPTEEWRYLLGRRLVAVGYVDVLPDGLSAIYFYWDPEQRRRSLGTFNVLALLAAARDRQLPHVYLGYYVAGCRSLEYKARFRPYEVLERGGEWRRPATPPSPVLS
jgi:arginine-tRNA-protein transferase